MSTTAIVFDATGAYWVKDPAAVLDVGFDWSGWLTTAQAPSLDASVWSADAGLTLSGPQELDGVTSVLVSGGVAGQDYEVSNTVTSGVLVDVRRVRVRVRKT